MKKKDPARVGGVLLWVLSFIVGLNAAIAVPLSAAGDAETVNVAGTGEKGPEKRLVGRFSEEDLDGWEPKAFVGETAYQFVRHDNRSVLEAVSHKSASGLIRKIKVDLEKTPWLNWSWQIRTPLSGRFDEHTKPGDDYALRVYVVISGGIFIWNTRAMNYVWAAHAPKGDIWPNAFAPDNAVMMALRSSEDPVGEFVSEKRNVREDLKDAFKKDVRYIDAVVLMTDTDNTGGTAAAFYGDIFFSAE